MAKKKWKKKIGRALKAGITAYAASKMLGKKSPVEGLSTDKFDMEAKPIYKHDLESVAPKRFGIPDRVKSLPSGTQSGPKTWRDYKPDWWPWNKGGAIKAYQGQLVKSETRGTGAAVKGTTHEIMPGMDAAKHGKMIKAKQGTYAHEDESIGMRLGKKKSKHAKKVARDESYGDWGKRGKDWKVKKANHGTMVRTRGSNPDNPYVTQGGEVQIATKLNGVLKTRTW